MHSYVHLFLALSECGEKKRAMVEHFLILTSTEQHTLIGVAWINSRLISVLTQFWDDALELQWNGSNNRENVDDVR